MTIVDRDDRMQWIKDLERVRAGGQSAITEVELASEVRIPGVLDYADGAIRCGGLTLDRGADGLYKYLLRCQSPYGPFTFTAGRPRGYVFPGGVTGELVAILSLFFQARFFVLSHAYGELSATGLKVKTEYPLLRAPVREAVDPVIFGRRPRNFGTGLAEFLDCVARAEAPSHQGLILAFHHYARALREIGRDPEMVFVRLVSAVEAVAPPVVLERDPLARKLLSVESRSLSLSESQQEELARMLESRRAKHRFVVFLEENSRGFFRGGKYAAPHTKITRKKLRGVLGAIYDARSGYLHRGDPMYLSQVAGFPRWDIDPSVGMILQNRRFTEKQKLPYAYWFHQLVRHCLLHYLAGLPTTASPPP
jgi:hypothetical protein